MGWGRVREPAPQPARPSWGGGGSFPQQLRRERWGVKNLSANICAFPSSWPRPDWRFPCLCPLSFRPALCLPPARPLPLPSPPPPPSPVSPTLPVSSSSLIMEGRWRHRVPDRWLKQQTFTSAQIRRLEVETEAWARVVSPDASRVTAGALFSPSLHLGVPRCLCPDLL